MIKVMPESTMNISNYERLRAWKEKIRQKKESSFCSFPLIIYSTSKGE